MNEKQRKLIELLKEMFQLNQTDLDFGIYRIMNQKAEEINQFLEKDLIKSIKEAFNSNNNDSLQKELEDKISSFKNDGFTEEQIENNQKIKELKEKLASSSNKENDENEIYSYLSNFFSRYYKDGDFVSLRRYKKDTYSIPYEGEEVKLHWANSDQYYIKTSEYFRDYTFVINDKKFHFKIVDADTEKNNNKADSDKERRFIIADENPVYEENGEIFIRFEYKPVGKESQTKINENTIKVILSSDESLIGLLKEKAPTERNKDRTILEKHLIDYTSRNSFDYFIHKDLKGFLSRELDFYIKNEILYVDDILESTTSKIENSLNKVKTFKKIGNKIIAFLSQLEDFQKKLWLKKKFIVDTNYCITLDKIDESFYSSILENEEQLKEWKELFGVVVKSIEDLKAEKFLVLDTKFFSSEFKDNLLNEFEDLDEQCDGVLINSENFNALDFIQKKYEGKIKCVYIDPPYNTGNDEFIYKDSYKESSWLSMFYDRVILAKSLMREDGAFFCSIDDNELHRAIMILNSIFGEENFITTIVIKMSRATGVKMAHEDNKPVRYKEYGLLYAKNKNYFKINPQYIETTEIDSRYNKFILNREDKPENWNVINISEILKQKNIKKEEDLVKFYETNGDSICRLAANDQDVFKTTKGQLYFQNIETSTGLNKFAYDGQKVLFYSSKLKNIGGKLKFGENAGDLWSDVVNYINDLSNEGGVSLQNGKKPEFLLNRIIEMLTDKEDYLLDFTLGSGSSIATSQKINRNFIGIEGMSYFLTLPLKRMKKVLYGEQRGISKSVNWKGGGMFKYFKLESYEDTLNNLAFKEPNKSLFDNNVKEDYLLNYMLDYETNESLLNIDSFKNPYDYKLKIASSSAGETIDTNIDLVETFNYLIGLKIKSRQKIKGFLTIEGENLKEEKILIIWRNGQTNQELNEFFSKQDYSVHDREFDTIYVNGDNNLANLKKDEEHFKVKLIEEEFKLKMFGE